MARGDGQDGNAPGEAMSSACSTPAQRSSDAPINQEQWLKLREHWYDGGRLSEWQIAAALNIACGDVVLSVAAPSTEYTGYAVVLDDPNDQHGFWWVGAWHNKEVADDIAKRNKPAAHVVPITSVVQSETGEWFDLDKCKPADKAMVRVRTFSGTETDARYWDGDFECECVLMPRWITGNKVFRWRAR